MTSGVEDPFARDAAWKAELEGPLRAGHGAAVDSGDVAKAADDARDGDSGWADVLMRAGQAQPLPASPPGQAPRAQAANQDPAAGTHQHRLARPGRALAAMVAVAGVLWVALPHRNPPPASEVGLIPSAQPGSAVDTARGAGANPAAAARVIVGDPTQAALQWQAALRERGARVEMRSQSELAVTLHIEVQDEPGRADVSRWLAAQDQYLDATGRLDVVLTAHGQR